MHAGSPFENDPPRTCVLLRIERGGEKQITHTVCCSLVKLWVQKLPEQMWKILTWARSIRDPEGGWPRGARPIALRAGRL